MKEVEYKLNVAANSDSDKKIRGDVYTTAYVGEELPEGALDWDIAKASDDDSEEVDFDYDFYIDVGSDSTPKPAFSLLYIKHLLFNFFQDLCVYPRSWLVAGLFFVLFEAVFWLSNISVCVRGGCPDPYSWGWAFVALFVSVFLFGLFIKFAAREVRG